MSKESDYRWLNKYMNQEVTPSKKRTKKGFPTLDECIRDAETTDQLDDNSRPRVLKELERQKKAEKKKEMDKIFDDMGWD